MLVSPATITQYHTLRGEDGAKRHIRRTLQSKKRCAGITKGHAVPELTRTNVLREDTKCVRDVFRVFCFFTVSLKPCQVYDLTREIRHVEI